MRIANPLNCDKGALIVNKPRFEYCLIVLTWQRLVLARGATQVDEEDRSNPADV